MKIPGLAVLLCLAATTTTFALEPGTTANELKDGYSYVIKNVMTQTVLDLAGTGNHSVTGWSPKSDTDNTNQRWTLTRRRSPNVDHWRILSDATKSSDTDKAFVVVQNGLVTAAPITDDSSGWWNISIANDSELPVFRILDINSTMMLELKDQNSDNGTLVQLGNSDQRWTFSQAI